MISFFDFTFIKSISVNLSLSLSDKDSKSCVITERSPNSMIILLFLKAIEFLLTFVLAQYQLTGLSSKILGSDLIWIYSVEFVRRYPYNIS